MVEVSKLRRVSTEQSEEDRERVRQQFADASRQLREAAMAPVLAAIEQFKRSLWEAHDRQWQQIIETITQPSRMVADEIGRWLTGPDSYYGNVWRLCEGDQPERWAAARWLADYAYRPMILSAAERRALADLAASCGTTPERYLIDHALPITLREAADDPDRPRDPDTPMMTLADWLLGRARRRAQDMLGGEAYGGRQNVTAARWVSAETAGLELWQVAADDPERDTVGLFTACEILWHLERRLTTREMELITLLLRDRTDGEIAARLNTTEGNIRVMRHRVREKFRRGVESA